MNSHSTTTFSKTVNCLARKDKKDTLRIMKQHFKENVIGVLNESVADEALLSQVTSIQGDNGELKSRVVLFSPHSGRKSRPHGPEDKFRRTEKKDSFGRTLIKDSI